MANWSTFVSQVKALPIVKQRAVSAIVGAVVADAAAQPLFWIYDQDKIVKCLEGGKNPEFYEPTQNPFFIIPTGSQTMYGDCTLAGIRGLLQGKGFNADAMKEELYKAFGPASPYEKVEYTGKYPVTGPYKSGTVKNFLKNYVAGNPTGAGGNSDGEGLCLTVPVIAMFHDTTDVKTLCANSFKILQDNAIGIDNAQAACMILQTIITKGADPEDSVGVIESVIPHFKAATEAALRSVVSMNGKYSVSEGSKKLGLPCAMPQTLQAALYGMLGKDNNYVKAVRDTIIAGGNSAFRALYVGACMGAKYGIDGIPEDWVAKVINKEELLENCLKLAEIMK